MLLKSEIDDFFTTLVAATAVNKPETPGIITEVLKTTVTCFNPKLKQEAREFLDKFRTVRKQLYPIFNNENYENLEKKVEGWLISVINDANLKYGDSNLSETLQSNKEILFSLIEKQPE